MVVFVYSGCSVFEDVLYEIKASFSTEAPSQVLSFNSYGRY